MRSPLRWRHFCLVLVASPLVWWITVIFATIVPRESVDGFRSRVERELPPGTPEAEVEAWLRAKGYAPAQLYFHGEKDHFGSWPDKAVKGLSGAFAKNYPLEFPIASSRMIQFTFYFDDQGRRTEAFDVSEFVYDH